MAKAITRRYLFIDGVRGLALFLAMLAHCFGQFWSEPFDALDPLELLTRTATPAFVILFGAMVELAYVRKLRQSGDLDRVERRLISRMLLCYGLFVLIMFAALTTGKLTGGQFIESITFLGGGRFGVILKVYSVLFLIVLVLLPLLVRFGAPVFLFAALGAWSIKFTLDRLFTGAPYGMTFLFGHEVGFGPAILPSLTFLGFGMAFAEGLTGRRSWRLAGILLAVSMALPAAEVIRYGLGRAGTHLIDYRWINHPLYFASGIVTTSLFLVIAWRLWSRSHVDPVSRSLATLGEQTLFVYAFGNVVLNLLPAYSGDAAIGLMYVGLFMSTLVALGLARPSHGARLDGMLLGLPSNVGLRYRAVEGSVVNPLQRTLRRFARRY